MRNTVNRKGQAVRLLAAAATLVSLSACRGMTSEKAPVHLNPNMDNVTYVEAQEPSSFFEDERGMRPQVEHTIAVGSLMDDQHLHMGLTDNNQWAGALPPAVLEGVRADEGQSQMAALLDRGEERFNIYCAPCHGEAGLENGGIVPTRGEASGDWSWFVPSLHGERQRGYAVGQIYDIISNGYSTMPAYRAQIPVEDRWAIAAWVRVLQVSQGATRAMLPSAVTQEQGW